MSETDYEVDETSYYEQSHHEPVIRLNGESVILEHGAVLPAECCVKCGRPAVKTYAKELRKPMNPATWFGKRESMEIGLCKKHQENRMICLALTWSLLGIGAAIVLMGALSLNVLAIISGLVFAGISGVFRAAYPCRLKTETEESLEIEGVGAGCRLVMEKAGVFSPVIEADEEEASAAAA